MSDDHIPVSAVEDNALPSLDGAIDEDMSVGEAEDRQHSPRETPLGSTAWGITPREERMGEPLDLRLASEEPETSIDDILIEPYPETSETGPAGRLVEPDAGLGGDREADLVATDVGRDRGARSAEEAAMRITDEVPGGTWTGGGYVEDDQER